MSQQKPFHKIALLFFLAFVAILAITIAKYVNGNRSQEAAITKALEEIDKPKENVEQVANPDLPTISVEEARKKIYTLFIDLRLRSIYDQDHIRKSVHIESFRAEEFPTVKTLILVQDGTENTANQDKLIALVKSMPDQYETFVLEGGFAAWKKTGIPTVTKADPTNEVDLLKIKPAEPRDIDAVRADASTLIIDTRSSSAYKKSHVPGAINIPYGRIEHEQRKISPVKNLYVYGADDLTSFEAGVLLYDLNYSNTYTMVGGFAAWQEYGYPTETDS